MSLNHPAFAGRVRTYSRRATYERRSVVGRSTGVRRRLISDMRPAAAPTVMSTPPCKPFGPRPVAKSVPSRQRRSVVLKRQAVEAPSKVTYRQKGWNLKGVALTACASILIVFGLSVAGLQLLTNHKVTAQVQALTTKQPASASSVPTNSDVPAETSNGLLKDYHVAARAPRVLRISKLGVEAKVLSLGVDANNQLRTPTTIYDVGWYTGSAMPGDLGAVLLDGHVHGPTQPGVFVGLKKLKTGDKITIERGDGKIFTYHVVKTQSYAKDAVDMGAAFSSAVPGKPGLNMITCDGTYDNAGEYNNRLIVFAVQE